MKNWLVPVVFTMFLFNACKNKPLEESNGKLRLANASYLSGDINLFIEYDPVYETNVQYLNYALFRKFIAGNRKLQIKTAAGNTLVDTNILIEENRTYTAFVYDSLGSVKYKLVRENFITPTGSTCKVRFMHLSNDAPTIHAVQQNDTTFRFQSYRNGQYSEYTPMFIGDQIIHLYDSATNSLFYSKLDTYQPGYFYTIYLKGNMLSTGNDSIGLFTIEENGTYD